MDRVLGMGSAAQARGRVGQLGEPAARPTSEVESAVRGGIAGVIAHVSGDVLLKARELEARFVLGGDELAKRLGDQTLDQAYRVRLLNELNGPVNRPRRPTGALALLKV